MNVTFVLPVPLELAALRCNHGAFAVAVQLAISGVTVSETLLLPATKLTESDVVLSVLLGATPKPVSAMSNGFSSGSLFTMCMAAMRVLVAVGAKLTVNVVLAFGARFTLPMLLTMKSPAFAPSFVMASPARLVVPLLVMTKVLIVLVNPT